MPPGKIRKVAVLGSTGSIGVASLDVISKVLPLNLEVFGLACASNTGLLAEQIAQHKPKRVVIQDSRAAALFQTQAGQSVRVETGAEALNDLASDPEVDIVIMAVVGGAALEPTLAALRSGKTVALANKECLVMAGALVTAEAQKHAGRIIPVDSEHSAAFQLMKTGRTSEIRRLIITSSGGALRNIPLEDLANVTPEQALNHPTWNMGQKVTIDSATSINKALELIEAHHLFGLPAKSLAVWVHPQSIIHAVVEYADGSTILHASQPDMRLPIQYALGLDGPGRVPGCVSTLPVKTLSGLSLSEPDPKRMPAIALGLEVCERGGTLGAVLNAANEIAVDAFLAGKIPFTKIVSLVEEVMQIHKITANPSLEQILTADSWAREQALMRF